MMANKLPPEDNAWDAKPSETVLPDKPYNLDFVMVPAATIEGELIDGEGKPIGEEGVSVTYSSNTKTNAFGRFHFSSPFKVAARILVNGGGKLEPSEYREVENGREDADFQLSTEKGRVSEDLNPLGLDDDSNDTAAETPLPKMIGISEANAGQETAARRNPPPDADRPAPGGKDEDTAKIELTLGIDDVRTISVALGQSAVDIHNLCKPAKVYADDDPWLIAPAAGGGSYVFFFAAEGTPEAMRGRLDPSRDNYRHGDEPEAIYLLPRSKRGKPVAAEYRELLGIDASKSGTDKSRSSEKSTGTTPDNTSESELVTEANVAT